MPRIDAFAPYQEVAPDTANKLPSDASLRAGMASICAGGMSWAGGIPSNGCPLTYL